MLNFLRVYFNDDDGCRLLGLIFLPIRKQYETFFVRAMNYWLFVNYGDILIFVF